MSLCLSMIVKNEAHVIARCLRSVKPFIDSYSISDTGSTDNTMDIIREELAGIPGVLTSDPWLGFGPSRNVALAHCTGSHILTMDADAELEHTGGPIELPLEFDCFDVEVYFFNHSLKWWSPKIIRNDPRWKWEGKIHEVLQFDGKVKGRRIENLRVKEYSDSHQNISGNKSLVYLEHFENEPATPRNVFYHAGTLWDLKRWEESMAKYLERVAMGGWEEEVYYSRWRAAECMQQLSRPFYDTAGALFSAYVSRPSRYEALASLCSLLGRNKRWEESYALSSIGVRPPTDILFVNPNAEWHVLDEHALAAYYLGRIDEAKTCWLCVSDSYQLDEASCERITQNISFCK